MNRISISEGYHTEGTCAIFDNCERFYCREHRLLYRACDTAYQDTEGDEDVIDGRRIFWSSSNECPECIYESRNKKQLHEAQIGVKLNQGGVQ